MFKKILWPILVIIILIILYFLSKKKNKIPWIPIKAKIWLDKNLSKDMIIFEYGSGLSTLYFSTKVNKIISIEHDKKWYKKQIWI